MVSTCRRFEVEGILIQVSGWIFIPGLPSHKSAWYLTEEEKEHAILRLGQSRKRTWDRTVFKRVFLSWQFWLLPTIFMRKLSNGARQWQVLNRHSLLSRDPDGAE